jgi:cytochrome c556
VASKTILTALTLACVATAAVGAPDPAPPPATAGGKALVARQAHFREQNAAFRSVNEDLRKDTPDKATLAADAARLKTVAADLPTWFPKGSGPETGLKTAAKAEIWTDAEGFAAAATRFQTETVKLEQLAAAGDVEAAKAQLKATAAACKACHDKYRASETR